MPNEPMFDPKELRSMQLEAIEYCLRQDLLAAKIKYQDAMRRMDYTSIKYVARECNLVIDYSLGVVPIVFLEN